MRGGFSFTRNDRASNAFGPTRLTPWYPKSEELGTEWDLPSIQETDSLFHGSNRYQKVDVLNSSRGKNSKC
ncbi:hypothetical protein AB6A40_000143 [Gnathostoma spinigerum]|uniref:Uncharacterized protein n=1 Tax=Gnathostoma spinigerum TaxID=75299 RepID=A0ABD6E5R7_9BILA